MGSTTFSFPKYRLHRGSGQAFIQIKGKRHYLGVFNSPESKERYSRFIAEAAVNPLPAPPPAAQEDLTVVELCRRLHRPRPRVLPQKWRAYPPNRHHRPDSRHCPRSLRIDARRPIRPEFPASDPTPLDREKSVSPVH